MGWRPFGGWVASGRAHAAASLILALPCGIAIGWLTNDAGAGMLAAAGCGVGGIVLSPDLDMAQEITESERLVIRRLGPLGWLWTLLFWPYGILVPHRDWKSHAPIIGTLGRLLYLALPLLLLARWQGWTLAIPDWLWPWAVGLAVADSIHWMMDKCPT